MKNNQDLYVMYLAAGSTGQEEVKEQAAAPRMCVLSTTCKEKKCRIDYNKGHALMDAEMPDGIQPFFLDIDGDLK